YKVVTNIRRIDTPKYKLNNIVIFNIENHTINRPVVKLLLKFEGPFCIIKVDFYLLELSLLINIKVTYIISISKVKPYIEGLLG
ncbi:hypothetical protein GE21DRAFT_1219591, partial [Neurospora crassa]